MRRCMGCMRTFDEQYEVCPYCGYIVGTEPESYNHLPPGTILQRRYILGRVLGQGGFGITYIAWDSKLEHAVAIKEYLPTSFASRWTDRNLVTCFGSDAKEQFDRGMRKIKQESLTIASLHDIDGVVRIYDFIEENATAYIIMELLRGRTVRELLAERHALPFAEAMRIMRPVLLTLSAMHEKGIIHRDVAPDNIFVCDDGRVKLLDFGAARLAYSEADEKSVSVILKHGYAPREQYASHAVQGPYTDVYAACATMYRLLTGTMPPESIERKGNDREELRPLLELDIPRKAKTAIVQGMRVEKEKRTQTVAEVLSQLEPYLPQADGKAPAASEKPASGKKKKLRRLRAALYVAVPILIALIVIGVLTLLR